MRVHVVVDFTYIIYKYKFTLMSGRLKTLTYNDRDVSLLYYCLKEVESFRSKLEKVGHDVTMTICFDSKSIRKEQAEKLGEDYKGKRESKLNNSDFELIEEIKGIFENIGYNVLKQAGYEADDLVYTIVQREKKNFDFTIIYTPDKDVLINIEDNVAVMRYKQKKGYIQVEKSNFNSIMIDEFKCYIPYNVLALYLSSVGDKSDNIKGIHLFGPAAYERLIGKLIEAGYGDDGWDKYKDFNEMAKLIEACKQFLNEEQFKDLKQSFSLVKPIIVEDKFLPEKLTTGSQESREKIYSKYGFQSLYS